MAQSRFSSSLRPSRSIVVVGASAGGVPALIRLVSGLDSDLEAAIVVVLHLPPNARSVLPDILTRAGALPAAHPRDCEPLVAGHIYVAPPDRHLLLQDDMLRLTVGPWENGHRPSVDALFRSAARWHGSAVISVILTGALDDGAAGVAAIDGHGGMVLVQDPVDAEVAEMPTRALEAVPDAFSGTVDDIARQINKLVRVAPTRTVPELSDAYTDEFKIAEGARRTPEQMGEVPAGLVCPDCNGSLFEVGADDVLRFRCRVGHAWTADALSDANRHELEAALYIALRVLEEDQAVRARMASRARSHGRDRSARRYSEISAEREPVIEIIRQAIAKVARESENGSGEVTEPA